MWTQEVASAAVVNVMHPTNVNAVDLENDVHQMLIVVEDQLELKIWRFHVLTVFVLFKSNAVQSII